MRAKEFVINVPINIKINGDDELEVSTSDDSVDDGQNKIVSPLQQELELKKAEMGKESEVIDQITRDEDDEYDEEF